MIHTGEKKYSCAFCDFRTAYKHNLSSHWSKEVKGLTLKETNLKKSPNSIRENAARVHHQVKRL
jgi:uncharacterized Zn-finger protein